MRRYPDRGGATSDDHSDWSSAIETLLKFQIGADYVGLVETQREIRRRYFALKYPEIMARTEQSRKSNRAHIKWCLVFDMKEAEQIANRRVRWIPRNCRGDHAVSQWILREL
jgi:hypothetical protein